MAASQSEIPDKRPVSGAPQGRAGTRDDEIDLMDYFRIVWKWKYVVISGAVVPALLVWLVLFFSPSEYRVTFTYDMRPDARAFGTPLGQVQDQGSPDEPADKVKKTVPTENDDRILLDRFYSGENLDKLAAKLKDHGFEGYARDVSAAKIQLIQLEFSDSRPSVTITGRRGQDLRRISLIVRDNLEKVIPLYFVKEHLSGEMARLKTEMAGIEENRFALELELERRKAILARLKALALAETGGAPGGLVLHFESVRENSEYLPLAYQVQAADVNIISIEQTLRANQERYSYYGGLLALNQRLLDEVRSKTASYYTIEQFHSFLTRIMDDSESRELRDYVSAYIKRIENVISANTPIVERPRISSVPKGGLRAAGIVFVALLMLTTFGAFLLEAAQKSRQPAAVKSS